MNENTVKYYGEAVDVSELVIAEVTGDDDLNYTAGTPYMLAPVATVAKETTTNTKTRYYSGQPLFVDTAEGETKVTVVVPGLTVSARAELAGKTYNTEKGLLYDDGQPGNKWWALGYRIKHAGDVDEYIWLAKGKFSIPREEGQTSETQINEKTLTVEYTAVNTKTKFKITESRNAGIKAVYGDTSDDKFTLGESWFNSVTAALPAKAEAA